MQPHTRMSITYKEMHAVSGTAVTRKYRLA